MLGTHWKDCLILLDQSIICAIICLVRGVAIGAQTEPVTLSR